MLPALKLMLLGGDARAQLTRLLRRSGVCIANYQPGVGVTGTLTNTSWANQIGVAPALAEVAGSGPIIVSNDSVPKAVFFGAANNSITTVNAAANQITGDICLAADVAFDVWGTGAALISKDDVGGNRAYGFGVTGADKIYFYSSAMVGVAASSVVTGLGSRVRRSIAVTRQASSGDVKFFASAQNLADDISTMSWAQLGSTQNAGAGNLPDKNISVYFGVQANGTSNPFSGQGFKGQIFNGIPAALGGAASNVPVQVMNTADSAETSTNGATWTSSATGETYTLNNTGATPAMIARSPMYLFSAHAMKTGTFTLPQPVVNYFVGKPITWSNNKCYYDGDAIGNRMAFVQKGVSPATIIYAGTADAASETNFALGAFALSSVVFNGAASSSQINNNTAATGSPGTNAPNGLTLGGDYSGLGSFTNFLVKEWIAVSATSINQQIKSLLYAIHGITP